MKHEERLIVSAYTGVLMVPFSDLHGYIEQLLGRPVWTHELAKKSITDEIKDKCRADFLKLCESW